MVTTSEIQHVRIKGELPFQEFCLKLARLVWNDRYAELYGRSGQKQHGVDIIGEDRREGYRHAGMQCKASETDDPRQVTEAELVEEVEKAKARKPPLDILIVAYGGNRDVRLQDRALELTEANRKDGLFRVVVWSWDDVIKQTLAFPQLTEELLVRNEVPTVAELNPRRPSSTGIENFQADVLAAIARLRDTLPASDAAAPGDDPVLSGQLDIYREHIRAGEGPRIVEAMRVFIHALSAGASPHIRLRAQGNLGSALIQAGEFEAGVICFEEAAKAEPDSVYGYAYKSRAALARHHPAEAFAAAEVGLAMDPTNVLCATILVDAASDDTPASELEERVGALATDVDIAGALERRYANLEHDYENSLRIARGIVPQNWQKDAFVGLAVLGRFEHNEAARVGAPLSRDELLLLGEARESLVRAWAHIRTRTDARNWAFVGANLASAFRLLGREDEADKVSIESHTLDPDNYDLMQRAVVAAIRAKDTAKAHLLAGKLARSDRADDLLLAASVMATNAEWSDAEANAREGFDATDAEPRDKARAAELLIAARNAQAGHEDALKIADEFRAQFPPSVIFEARVAEIARRGGDSAALGAAMARLSAFDVSTLGPIDRFELADALADAGQWAKAANLLKDLYSVDRYSELVRRRLFYLYRADDRAAARAMYNELSPEARKYPEVLGLGAAIFERSGMLPEALQALDEAVALAPAYLRSRLDWVRIAVRSGQQKKASSWVRRNKAAFDGDPDDLIELSQVYDRYNRRADAMRLGYETLRRHWGESERIHMGYMSLFLMNSRRDALLHPKLVVEDNVVFLAGPHGETRKYRIEADSETSAEVVPPDSAVAKSLIGKEVGDTVEFGGGLGQSTAWTITEIKHKYIDLLHLAMEAHSTTFPSSRTMGMIHVETTGDDAFEPIFEQARDRARYVRDAVRLYGDKTVPLDTVAKIIGTDPIDTSIGLRFSSDVRFENCIGVRAERERAFAQLKGATGFLVDPVTLDIWQQIALLEVLEPLPFKTYVVQSTIDLLTERAERARLAVGQKGGSLEPVEDRFIFVEPTKEQREAIAKRREDLLAWVRAHATIVPTSPIAAPEGTDLTMLLSEPSIDTIAAAKETGLPAIFEDRRLRIVAAELGVPRTTWTQPFLVGLRDVVSHDVYIRLIAALQQQRVGFTSLGSMDLLLAAHLGHGSETYRGLADAITGPFVEHVSLVQVLAEYITFLWADPAWRDTRDGLVSELFDRLLCHPSGIHIIRTIVVSVSDNIQGFPYPERLIATFWLDYVERFAVGHFIDI